MSLTRSSSVRARPGSQIPLDITVQFVAGAYMSLLTAWADSGAKHTPEEMDRMFRTLATGCVSTAFTTWPAGRALS